MATGAFGTVKQFREMDILAKRVFASGANVMSQPEFLTGNVFYVNSAGAGGDGTSPAAAVTTLDAAFALCTANNGDKIIVMPNHAETITGAGGITHDVAGVSVIGLGRGSQRPQFLMDAGTAVSYLISASDAYVDNLVFVGGHASIVTCFDITSSWAWLNRLEFRDNTTNENFLTPVKATSTTDNNADGLRVTGCRWLTADADALEFVEINANAAGVVIAENFVVSAGTATPLVLTAGAKVLTGAYIGNNILQNANTANDLLIDNGGAANTGIVAYNLVGNLDVTGAQLLGAATGLQFFENYATSTSTESGAVAPAADTPNS